MGTLERARRVVGAAYARRHADALMLELIDSLERESAELQAEADAKWWTGCTRTRRYVVGRTITASIVFIGIALALYWYQFTAEGACFKAGFEVGRRRGSVAAASAVCGTSTNHSKLPDGMGSTTGGDNGAP